ncbi:MAG: DUF3127 domain-containing protein [Gammaproteobacteria bacterium]
MGIQASGRLHAIFETKQITERFQKREFVLELADNPNYPQFVLFELTGDRCGDIEGFKVDEKVLVEFNLRGREWNSPNGDVKYFNGLDVRTIARIGAPRFAEEESPPSGDAPLFDDGVPF